MFWGITPSFFWLAKIVLAQIVPPFVEQMHVGDLLDPFWSWVMRRVWYRRYVIEKERLLRGGGIQFRQILDCFVGHIGDQVVAGLPNPREDRGMIAEEIGRPLIGFTAHEPVEVPKPIPLGHWSKGPARL